MPESYEVVNEELDEMPPLEEVYDARFEQSELFQSKYSIVDENGTVIETFDTILDAMQFVRDADTNDSE
jgi:hypothetical protein